MKKNTFNKFILPIILLIIILIIYFIYNPINFSNKSNNTTPNTSATTQNNIKLCLGNYTINEVQTNESGVSNEECGITLKENNKFEIYMGWGAWHSGKYEIKEKNLICSSTLFESESGGYIKKNTNVIFIFNIINENKLELTNIIINDTKNEKLIYEDGLTIGMTYSIK